MRSRAIYLRSPTLPMIQASTISSFLVTTKSYRDRDQMHRTSPTSASCNHFSTNTGIFSPISSDSNLGRLPLWIDTDVGFDDLVAIGCCYDATGDKSNDNEKSNNRSDATEGSTIANQTRLVGISTVRNGLTSDPLNGVAILRGLLPGASGQPNAIPIIAGNREGRLSTAKDDPAWLATCREQMNEFCSDEGISLSSTLDEDNRRSETSDKKFHSTPPEIFVTESKKHCNDDCDTKMDLVCLGPLTNLAQWLEEIPERSTHRLNSIWILGGNIPIRQSLPNDERHSIEERRVDAEFNFARDPEAVRTVLHHVRLRNTTINIVPQEVCNRKAFEGSFCPEQNLCAAEIIENWLQSKVQEAPILKDETQTKTNDATSVSVESLLPPWLVRLIRKRTFSVYGDPICMYARHSSEIIDLNRNQSKSSFISTSAQHEVGWKEYDARGWNTTSTASNEFLAVDSNGRLILHDNQSDEKSELRSQSTVAVPMMSEHDGKDQYEKAESGNTVRIAHEVALGQDYLDWLAASLISSFRKRR